MTIAIKRVYEPASPRDGARFLVERLWPRGMKKEALAMDGWLRDAAPGTELRRWFAHDPAKWPEFQRRYRRELQSRQPILAPLVAAAHRGPLTLLYSARDSERNSAVVLREFLEEQQQRTAKPVSRGEQPRRSAARKN